MGKLRAWRWPVLLATMLLAACSGEALVLRWRKPGFLAKEAGWVVERVPAGPFLLTAAHSLPQPQSSRLTIFIEGDGLAFLGSRQISPDPTPLDPVALRLALRHPGTNAAWLGRPCQFVPQDIRQPACDNSLWTSARYSPQVVTVLDKAVDHLKAEFGARALVLAGYSGGGALAVLVAARRTDVVGLITVASPLDMTTWTRTERLAPLSGSLDPADVATDVAGIPQVHFVGGRDDVVGGTPVRTYLQHMPQGHRAMVRVIPDFDHDCCWARDWRSLVQSVAWISE